MEGRKITIDELTRKGYIFDGSIGVSDIYKKPYSWGEKRLLYQPERGEILINVRVPRGTYKK